MQTAASSSHSAIRQLFVVVRIGSKDPDGAIVSRSTSWVPGCNCVDPACGHMQEHDAGWGDYKGGGRTHKCSELLCSHPTIGRHIGRRGWRKERLALATRGGGGKRGARVAKFMPESLLDYEVSRALVAFKRILHVTRLGIKNAIQ